jgi:hypothetical protein
MEAARLRDEMFILQKKLETMKKWIHLGKGDRRSTSAIKVHLTDFNF